MYVTQGTYAIRTSHTIRKRSYLKILSRVRGTSHGECIHIFTCDINKCATGEPATGTLHMFSNMKYICSRVIRTSMVQVNLVPVHTIYSRTYYI